MFKKPWCQDVMGVTSHTSRKISIKKFCVLWVLQDFSSLFHKEPWTLGIWVMNTHTHICVCLCLYVCMYVYTPGLDSTSCEIHTFGNSLGNIIIFILFLIYVHVGICVYVFIYACGFPEWSEVIGFHAVVVIKCSYELLHEFKEPRSSKHYLTA